MSEESLSLMEKRLETAWLAAFYGSLLTENQREILRLYCEEDLSLGEIAQQKEISRQGVHDALRRAENQLRELESKLGLYGRFRRTEEKLRGCVRILHPMKDNPDVARALDIIDQILSEEER